MIQAISTHNDKWWPNDNHRLLYGSFSIPTCSIFNSAYPHWRPQEFLTFQDAELRTNILLSGLGSLSYVIGSIVSLWLRRGV